MKDYPTPWQRKTMWAALSALFVVFLIVIVGAVIWTGANIISFLQPILIPVAIAMILTYLLDPLVTKMSRGGLSRTKTVALLFAIVFVALGGLIAWLVPTISIQSANFARQVPAYTERARDRVVDLIYRFDQTFGFLGGGREKSASSSFTNWLVGSAPPSPPVQPTTTPTASPNAATSPRASAPATETIAPNPSKLTTAERQRIQAYGEKQIPHRVFSLSVARLFSRWRAHWRRPDAFRAQFCASHWRTCCHPYDGPVHRDNYLLGTSRLNRRFSMGRLDTSSHRDWDFHPHPESRRDILRSAHCGKFCRPASNDSDRVDLCLGLDNRRSAWPTPGRAVDGNNQSVTHKICLGPASEGAGHGIDGRNSCA